MNFFDSTLIYPIFDVESIGDGPRVPRAHLEVINFGGSMIVRAQPCRCALGFSCCVSVESNKPPSTAVD